MPGEDSTIEGEGGDRDREAVSLPAQDPPPAWRRPAAPARGATGPPAHGRRGRRALRRATSTKQSALPLCISPWRGSSARSDARAYKLYRDRLLVECGSPTDPIEIMLIEQLALVSFEHRDACISSRPRPTAWRRRGPTAALAIALAGEFRRGALALKAYRARPQAGEGRSPMADVSGGDPLVS